MITFLKKKKMANVEADSDRSDDDYMFNNLFEN